MTWSLPLSLSLAPVSSSESSSSLEQEKYLQAILSSIPIYFKSNSSSTLSNRSLIGLSPGTSLSVPLIHFPEPQMLGLVFDFHRVLSPCSFLSLPKLLFKLMGLSCRGTKAQCVLLHKGNRTRKGHLESVILLQLIQWKQPASSAKCLTHNGPHLSIFYLRYV